MPSSVPTQISSTSTRAHERPLGCTRHDACTHGRTRTRERAREHGNAPVSGWAATCAAWAGSVTGAAAMPKLRSPGGRSRDRNASSDRVALALACASGCKAPTCAALRVSASVRPPSHSAGVRDRGAEPTASPASHASLVMPPLSSRPWRRPRTCTRAHQARDTRVSACTRQTNKRARKSVHLLRRTHTLACMSTHQDSHLSVGEHVRQLGRVYVRARCSRYRQRTDGRGV